MPTPRTAAEYLEAAEAEARRLRAFAALAAIPPPPEPEPEPIPVLDPGPPQPVDPEVVVAWQGEWTWEREYVRGQLVSWRGSSYLCLEDNQLRAPDEYPGIWALVAARGAKGDNGRNGEDGLRGPRGYPGASGLSAQVATGGGGASIGDFADWVPDAISQGGALTYTIENARTLSLGKLAMISLRVTFTDAGTPGAPLVLTLPSGLTLASNGAETIGSFVYTQAAGTASPTCTSIFVGSGDPDAGLGAVGDSYIDEDNGDLWVKD